MTKQTILLFVKALVIGVLLNIGLQQAANMPLAENSSALKNVHQTLTVPSADTQANNFNPSE